MPDFVTHALTGHVMQRLSPRRIDYATVLVGSLLPDLVSWLPLNVELLLEPYGFPSESERYFPPMHSLCLVLLWSWLLSLLFVPEERRLVLRSLALGGIAHIFLDSLQYKFDSGYLVLYPLYLKRVQIGLVAQDAWYLWIATGLLATALVEVWRRRRMRMET